MIPASVGLYSQRNEVDQSNRNIDAIPSFAKEDTLEMNANCRSDMKTKSQKLD